MGRRIRIGITIVACVLSQAASAAAQDEVVWEAGDEPVVSSAPEVTWQPPSETSPSQAPPPQVIEAETGGLTVVVEEEEEIEAELPPARAWGGGDPETRFLHGVRLGYGFFGGGEEQLERLGLDTPHTFLMGYEIAMRMVGESWLDVLLVANVMIAGLEQSAFLPSGNLLVGFELERSLQVGVGVNFTPERDDFSHVILAAGWTPWAGGFYTPIHLFFIPDTEGHHRGGLTVGVTW